MRSQRFGLAGVQTLGLKELVEAGIDTVGHLVQQRHALGHWHAPPLTVQGITGSGHGGINLDLAALVHPRNHFAVSGIDILESVTALRGNILAIDKVLDLVHHQLHYLRASTGSQTAAREPSIGKNLTM